MCESTCTHYISLSVPKCHLVARPDDRKIEFIDFFFADDITRDTPGCLGPTHLTLVNDCCRAGAGGARYGPFDRGNFKT